MKVMNGIPPSRSLEWKFSVSAPKEIAFSRDLNRAAATIGGIEIL
jgi:hypothetical protein